MQVGNKFKIKIGIMRKKRNIMIDWLIVWKGIYNQS